MPLRERSLFLYGYEVNEYNRSIDFKTAPAGPELQATLKLGFYSLTTLLLEVKRAMEEADPVHTYAASADRTVSGGTQNRVTVSVAYSYLSLLFGSGSRAGSSAAALLGFTATDKTGAVTYTGSFSSGTILLTDPNIPGSDYRPPHLFKENRGAVNRSASGKKEAIVFQVTRYWQVRYKYILESDTVAWAALLTWMIGQRLIEWTPEVSSPNVFFQGTLESTSEDNKGLGFNLQEMTPSMIGLYDTGLMKFQVEEL
jgi:hypothetical protein